MKDLKDQLREVKRNLKQQSREARRNRAAVRERVQKDEWKSFKAECQALRK